MPRNDLSANHPHRANGSPGDQSEQMLVALRRVMRAVDMHSRSLYQRYGLTGPQAILLNATVRAGSLTAGELARRVSLSQATLTGIFKRLEERGLLERRRDQADRRCVVLRATEAGYNVVAGSPPLLQETFVQRFGQLTAWEQNLLLSSVQRVAELMDAETLEAAPLLSSQSTLDQTD